MTDLRSFAEMLVDAEKRIAELEAALRRVAEEPNIDKARAIADAVLSSKR